MNDDLISRQAAIELILSGKVDDDSPELVGAECPEECNSFLEWAAEEVGKMPPAERKKGRWELAEDGWYCSSCKLYPPFDCDPEEKGIPFCPNCGAEMRGDKDE